MPASVVTQTSAVSCQYNDTTRKSSGAPVVCRWEKSRYFAGGLTPLALERGKPEIAERLVAFLHGLPEAGFGGAPLKGIAFGRVPRDAVEDRAENLSGLQALLHHRLVQQQLHHHQLIDRHARNAR